ncbi:hypothetical protein [Ensifer sp.]|jgi:hypothetical protein|uniref:hypothetical protein n=1 Tax=Ensifer sp. TaxID=1872086 RepID=UPI002E149971|nr:hypothetical protein [Ensifer sp.]
MSDSNPFNVRDLNGRLLCPACGYPDYACVPAYDTRGGLIGSAICPCCLWEPGFDDDPATSAKAEDGIVASLQTYRAAWGSALGWRGRMTEKPPGWDGERQLAHLFELAPGLR